MLTEYDGARDSDVHSQKTGHRLRDQRWLPAEVTYKLSLEGWVGATKTGKGEESCILGSGDRLKIWKLGGWWRTLGSAWWRRQNEFTLGAVR